MVTNSTGISLPTYTNTLSEAVAAFWDDTLIRPTPDVVVDALLEAEKMAKQQHLTDVFQSLLGRWRLCFATGTRKARQRGGIRLGRGWYMPKFATAQISFSASSQELEERFNSGEIGNQAELGPLLLKFTGPCKYLGKKNLLAFDFTRISVSLFKQTVYSGDIRGGKVQMQDFVEKPVSKLPFFAFFLVTDDFIAARGRGGGLALWVRDRE